MALEGEECHRPQALEATLIEIRSHTGLRGMAALLVVAYHLQYSSNHLHIEDASTFFRRSYLMVDLFFILSGFIMSYVYDGRFASTINRLQAQDFFVRRLIRLYPLHFLILLLMIAFRSSLAVLYVANGRLPPTDWSGASLVMLGAQFLLVNAWLPPPNGWNIPSWSISAEFIAYALFPVFVFLRTRSPGLFVTIAIAGVTCFYIFYPTSGSLDITGGLGAPARCLAGFVTGLLVHRFRNIVEDLNTHALSIVQVGALIWIVAVMTTFTHDSFVIPAFILLVASTWTDQGIIARNLGRRTMRQLGETSYAVYISHALIIGVLGFAWERTARRMIASPTLERGAFILACYVAVVGISILLHARFEKPMRSDLMARLNARSETSGDRGCEDVREVSRSPEPGD